ncbi:hypothetical protein XA68_17970 [Ophiocordyceps unilateralis]|uniref:Uncharacterized protein n=1 Tax=Ophiocordyceps unilateralis TaxID=268505 RepID=A0A2A9PI86_OPHUN|nr:hypothetical protein XA68_17970 [Ophiocordyceps unilateralis]
MARKKRDESGGLCGKTSTRTGRRDSVTQKSKKATVDDDKKDDIASSSSSSSSQQQQQQPEAKAEPESYPFLLFQGKLLEQYEDEIRNDLMELVDQIESEKEAQPTEEQKEKLAEVVTAYANAHAQQGASSQDMAQLVAGMRKKIKETIDGREGQRGTPYGKMIVWYGRELDKVQRGGQKKKNPPPK